MCVYLIVLIHTPDRRGREKRGYLGRLILKYNDQEVNTYRLTDTHRCLVGEVARVIIYMKDQEVNID